MRVCESGSGMLACAHLPRQHQPLDEEVKPNGLLVRRGEVVACEPVRQRGLPDRTVAKENNLVLQLLRLVVRVARSCLLRPGALLRGRAVHVGKQQNSPKEHSQTATVVFP